MKLLVSAKDLFGPRQIPACFGMSNQFSVKRGVGHLPRERLNSSFLYYPEDDLES